MLVFIDTIFYKFYIIRHIDMTILTFYIKTPSPYNITLYYLLDFMDIIFYTFYNFPKFNHLKYQ